MSIPKAQLSCAQCTSRRRKCDKLTPSCTACLKAGLDCDRVQRYRLPRGRSGNIGKPDGKGKAALKERVLRLGDVVSRLRNRGGGQADVATKHIKSTELTGFVAADFWEELSDAVWRCL